MMDSDKVATEGKEGLEGQGQEAHGRGAFSQRVEVNGGSRGPQPLGPNA